MNNLPPKRPVDFLVSGRREAIAKKICVMCKGLAIKFDDAVSAKEHQITGMCQTCQDSLYGGEK